MFVHKNRAQTCNVNSIPGKHLQNNNCAHAHSSPLPPALFLVLLAVLHLSIYLLDSTREHLIQGRFFFRKSAAFSLCIPKTHHVPELCNDRAGRAGVSV